MTLATYTAAGEAQCGKIVGIGMPPREEAYELTLEQDDGTVDYVVIPRVMEKSPDFHVGAYYVHFLKKAAQTHETPSKPPAGGESEPVDPAYLMDAGLFNALFTMSASSKQKLEKAKADAKKAAEEAAKASLKESAHGHSAHASSR